MKKIKLHLKIVLVLTLFTSGYNAQTAAALSFDGVDDYVNCGNILPGSYTKEAWINISTLSISNNIISSGGAGQHAFWVNSTLNRLSAGHNGVFTACQDPTALLNNTWYHVACTYDAATTTLRLYKNGVIVATNTSVPAFTGGNSARIGSYSPANHFSGRMDEVRIWNRALCQGEIQNNMNAEIATTANGLIANYHFNQGVASGTNTGITTLTDVSGSSNTGTLTNFALSGTSSNWISPGGVTTGSTVTAFINPTITITGTNSICGGFSAILTVTGDATTYTWTSGPNTQTYNVSPTVATTYSVVGLNALGCITNIASTTLSVSASPTVLVNSGAICNGSSFTIVPSGANTYTISGGSFIVAPNTNTSYTVTGINLNGCTNFNAAVSSITVNATSISVNSGAICQGSSFTINPSGGDTYTVSGGSSVVTPTANASYTVTGTSSQGCLTSTTAISSVTVNALPTVSSNSGVICSGDSFTVIPGGASSYSISGGSFIVSPTTNNTYSITGTDLNGCLSSNTAISSITVNVSPTVSVNSGVICSGNSFTIVPAGANTYTISGGSSVVAPTSDATYSVIGTDLNGCNNLSPAVSSVTVNVLPTISVNSGVVCAGESFTIVPSGADTYTISGGSSIVTPTATAFYNVNGTDINGCTSSSAAICSVTVNALPVITVPSTTICPGNVGTLIASGANTYTWSTGSNSVSISDSPTVSTTYTVNGSSSAGCIGVSAITATISVVSAPSLFVNSPTVCAGSSATLSASGVTTYTWNTGANTNSIVVTPTVNTTYSVSGNLTGCSVGATNVSTVNVNALPNVNVSSTIICAGETGTLTASGANSYVWNTGSTSADIIVSPTVTTSYTVNGFGVNGCVRTLVILQDVSECTGLVSLVNSSPIMAVYPNPNAGIFSVNLTSVSKITVVDALGKMVYEQQLQSGEHTINLTNYASGFYVLKAETNGHMKTVKLVKN